jgi:predicted regulator of Ras-like GTPase activity (Roadblock/LC7/MglB family)
MNALILIILVAAIIVLAWGYSGESIDRMGDLVEYVDVHENNTSRLVLTLGGAILMVIALIVLLIELSPGPSRLIEIGEVEGAKAFLSTDAIARRLEQLVSDVEGVIGSRAKVTLRGKAVAATLNLQVSPEEDIAAIADKASGLTRDALTQKMKVRLAEPPRIHITYVERPGVRAAVAPPAAPPIAHSAAPPAEPEPEERAGEDKEEV